jgi:hypothetical protein
MAAPATLEVFNILRDLAGNAISGATVRCVLSSGFATVTATGDSIAEVQLNATTDGTGRYAFTLVGTDLLSPANQVYTIQEPHRAYAIAPLSTNGASQQTTAGNVIVSTPTALAPATSNITGNLAVAGTLTVSGLGTFSAGLTVSGGTFSIPAGGFSMAGPLTLTAATSKIVPGATSFSVRNTTDANDNLLVSNAGLVTARAGLVATAGGITATAGDVAVTAGNLTFGAAASRIVPGVTSLALRNNANSADNVSITDAGVVTVRAGLTVTAGGLTITAGGETITSGNLTLTAGNLIFAAASAKILPGATSLLVRNNADSASNAVITDAGLVTLRNAIQVPPSAAGTVATSSYGSLPVKIQEIVTTSGQVNPTFSSIPTTFRGLRLTFTARDNTAGTTFSNLPMTLNGDGSALYDDQIIIITGTTVTGAELASQTSIRIGLITNGAATASMVSSGVIEFTNANDTNFFKQCSCTSVETHIVGTGPNVVHVTKGQYRSTSAITSITLAATFAANCILTLQGLP